MSVSGDESSELRVGTLFDGKYEILELVGAGGMGEVYKARHTHLHAVRCVKVMKRKLSQDEGFRARFMREARLATRVQHPNVATIYDFSIAPSGESYLVSEFIDGITLRQWAVQKGRFSLPAAIDIELQILAGLEEIHHQGLVHRDISAENVMVSYARDKWTAKIIDLGIAKALEAPASERTEIGLFVGNPRYASPEQLGELLEGEELDGRSDVYSAGILLFEMITGVPPFSSKTPQGYIVKHLKQPPPRPSDALPGSEWPAGFEEALLKALEKDRRQRYASARDFARALRPYLRTVSRTVEGRLQELIAATTPTPPPLRTSNKPLEPSQPKPPSVEVTERMEVSEDQLRPTIAEQASPQLPTLLDSPPTQRTVSDDRSEEESLAFDEAKNEDSSAGWQRFMERFPSSPRLVIARLLAEETGEYENLTAAPTIEKCDAFLQKWSGGTHGAAATQLRASIEAAQREAEERRKREPAEWDEAWRVGTSEAFANFINAHPSSSLLADAREALTEANAYEAAVRANSVGLLKAFLHDFPAARHFAEAEIRLGQLREEQERKRSVAASHKSLIDRIRRLT